MSQRISFFEFETPLSTEYIVNSLLEMRYTENKKSGFLLGKVKGDKIKAKHIYRYRVESNTVTPFGDIKKNSFEEYYINEFTMGNNYIEILNPARSLSHFRRDLVKALKNQCVISSLEFDLKSLVSALIKNYDSDVYVNCLEAFSNSFVRDSSLKVVLNSNRGAFEKLNELLPNDSYTLKKVNLILGYEGCQVELSLRGSVKFYGDKCSLDKKKSFMSFLFENKN